MATKPQEQEDTSFDDAFAKFANPENTVGGDLAGVEEPAADPEPAVVEGPAVAEEPAADPEPAVVEESAADASDAQTDALIARLAGLVKDAPQQPEPEVRPPAAAAPADMYDAAEKDFLAKYDEDWGDVARGEALKRRAEYHSLIGFVFEQVAAQLKPMAETVDVLSSRTHLSDLRGQVEDYDTVRDKVVSWVDEQPMYLQAGMKGVIQSGTADEVADLIARYRQATGATSRPAAPPAVSVELSNDAKKAAVALAPVNTKRSAVPTADDPGDFDAAFKHWASAGKSN